MKFQSCKIFSLPRNFAYNDICFVWSLASAVMISLLGHSALKREGILLLCFSFNVCREFSESFLLSAIWDMEKVDSYRMTKNRASSDFCE